MTRLGMSSADAYTLATNVKDAFDTRKMRAGNQWTAYFAADSNEVKSLKYLVYEEDKINMTVFQCADSLTCWKVSKPVDVQRVFSDVTISSSLWNDMRRSGISPLLIVELSEVYAWTVDFFGLQDGDRFRVVYDQEVVDSEVVAIGNIWYAQFDRDTVSLPAIRFDQGDSGNVWWNAKGESLKKAFLKAPLKFTRISSGFSYHRMHPIYHTVRAHTGVDYAAPTGTPVMALGDGTVISKGWGGGGGNTVKIRHNGVYTTGYLHLSRYAAGLHVGQRVSQGDVIGYVGMTGSATGPHLDFRVWKNGTPINPLKLESPSGEPIKPENLPALDSVYMSYRHEIDSLSSLRKGLSDTTFVESHFVVTDSASSIPSSVDSASAESSNGRTAKASSSRGNSSDGRFAKAESAKVRSASAGSSKGHTTSAKSSKGQTTSGRVS
jgi:murein DD-endopeptidase MepM/ murein hydrolase activator NlpD